MDEIDRLQAETLKALASPRRLEIVHRLAAEAWDVGRLARELGCSQPNVSQHLAVLRAAGVVNSERVGREVHYRLADDEVLLACSIMRGVLLRRLRRLADLSEADASPDVSDAPTTAARAAAAAPPPAPVATDPTRLLIAHH